MLECTHAHTTHSLQESSCESVNPQRKLSMVKSELNIEKCNWLVKRPGKQLCGEIS